MQPATQTIEPQRKIELKHKLAIDEAIISSVGDGLIITDKEAKILLMNPAAANMLKLDPKAAIGKGLIETVPAADRNGDIVPPPNRPLLTVLSTGQSFTNHTANFYIRSDKSKFPAAITTSPIILNGEIIGAIITFRDVTHEREVDRMKTEFISLASHQLRTPLSAIRWFLEMLLDGDAGPLNEEQTKFINNINDSTLRMIALVNDLLNISRIESGRIIIEPKPTHLPDLLNEVIEEFKLKYQAKRQKVIVSFHPDLPKINVDPNLIRAVYLNLLNNAIKYSPENGEITIMISKNNGEIISQISDNGYGIPQKEQHMVFQKFFRGSNIVKRVRDGTGLGLYLVKSIIESSYGKIWFKSEEEAGTTFWFSLPVSGVLPKKGEVTISN
jgi:PAS domain S-box-containing protein